MTASSSNTRLSHFPLVFGSAAVGVLGFLALVTILRIELSVPKAVAILAAGGVLTLSWFSLGWLWWKRSLSLAKGTVAICILIAAGAFMVATAANELAAYISLPVDLLSFSESPFVTDILKLRSGLSIYSLPQDNNSYPYNPGTQLLTYSIAAIFRKGDSIPVFRLVQISYVLLASIFATSICQLLARQLLAKWEYRHQFLWLPVWWAFLFLVSIDPRVNLYNHSLHNDGLALLISIIAYWLIVKHAISPRPWLLILMAILPSVGFLVKQNQVLWIGVFSLYLLLAGNVRWQHFLMFVVGSALLVAITVGVNRMIWGEYYLYWIFEALGSKQVSLPRSIQHLFYAGLYPMMGLLGGWVLVLRNGSRTTMALWLSWLIVFGLEAYTSGIGFQTNHMGPGAVLATCWFFVALLRLWPRADDTSTWWQYRAQEIMAVAMVVLLFGAMGFARQPSVVVPPDFDRYIAEIEQEFEGFETSKVLMDTGTWIYLRENVIMKDRSAPVSLHVGANQPEVNQSMLAATIERIRQRSYDKILARQLDTGDSWYDFQDRGSGVKDAILENYHEVNRIAGVEGIREWWPQHLVSEVLVYVPNQD